MIAEALKKALLQAAIQGKLTEQLPEDGDARELLKEIQKEKARLIKEGRVKREKPLAEINEDEIPFDIPENWVWARLGEISSRVSAGGDKPKQFSTSRTNSFNIPVISNGEQNEGIFGYTDKPVITETSITVSGRGTIGYSCVRNYPYVPIVRLISVTPISSVNPYYLKHVFSSLLESGVGTSIQQLTIPMIVTKLIPLPPLSEQQRIVKKLELLLPEIEDLRAEEKTLNNLEKAFPSKIRASILQAAIQGKLTEHLPEDGDARVLLKEIQKEKARLIKVGKIKKEKPLPAITEDEIPFDIPENWAWCRLGTLVSIKTGSKDANWGSPAGTYRFFTCAKETILSETFSFEGKSIVMPGNGANVGESWLIDEKFEAYQRTYVLQGTSDDVYLEYVRIVLSSDWKTRYSGGVYGSAIPYIRLGELTDYIFPLPPLSEQKRLVKKLDDLLPLCDALE